MTKTLLKRIESCEFLLTPTALFAWGKSGPLKGLLHVLSSATGYGVTPYEFEFHQMSQFSERLAKLKNLKIINPKDQEVQSAKLTGSIENYLEYNVVTPKSHEIDTVSGSLDGSEFGPLELTVGRKGKIRIKAQRGAMLTLECLQWILRMITEEQTAEDEDFLEV